MGFGARALEALNAFYSGEYLSLSEQPADPTNSMSFERAAKIKQSASLHEESLGLRDVTTMPPLLQRLSEIPPPALDYLGVSYGLTPSLLKFWKRAGYIPLYVRQTPSDLTGEYTCVMLRGVGIGEGPGKSPYIDWLTEFAKGLYIGVLCESVAKLFSRFQITLHFAPLLSLQGVWECAWTSSIRGC